MTNQDLVLKTEREEWKDYPVNDNYLVSSYGRVLSKKRPYIAGGLLNPRFNTGGYLYHGLQINENHLVHTMVLRTFDRLENKGEQCNHIDGNKENNHISNLEWCTSKQNINHAIKTGLAFTGSRNPRAIYQCDLKGDIVTRFKSINEAARKTGICAGNISCVLRGKTFTAGGYKWKYIKRKSHDK